MPAESGRPIGRGELATQLHGMTAVQLPLVAEPLHESVASFDSGLQLVETAWA